MPCFSITLYPEVTAQVNLSNARWNNTLSSYVIDNGRISKIYCNIITGYFGFLDCEYTHIFFMQLVGEQWKLFQSHNSSWNGAKWRYKRLHSDCSTMVLACYYLSYVHFNYTGCFTMVENHFALFSLKLSSVNRKAKAFFVDEILARTFRIRV